MATDLTIDIRCDSSGAEDALSELQFLIESIDRLVESGERGLCLPISLMSLFDLSPMG